MTTSAFQPAPLPVLLIEDEPSIMALVSATLERNGYGVVCIESGAEALRLLEKGKFLGVVSDMRTPGGVDGAQVHAWITANRPDLVHKVVIITGIMPTKKPSAPCAGSALSTLRSHSVCRILSPLLKKRWGKPDEPRAQQLHSEARFDEAQS